MIHRTVVAGYYYPAHATELADRLDRVAPHRDTAVPSPAHPATAGKEAAHAVIVPHGSMAQAGMVTGATLGRIQVPRRAIIVGPSHVDTWVPLNLMTTGAYRTPLGEVPVDTRCAEHLRALCPFLEVDAWGQRGEHSIEVVLPFLQRYGPEDLSIVPVIVGAEDPGQLAALGSGLAQVVRSAEEPVLLVASADFSRFRPHQVVAAQDERLAECLSALDGAAFLEAVASEGIMMCGHAAVASVVDAARALGARHVTRAAYRTSAQAGGDPDSSTGFAGFIIRASPA